MDSEPREIVRRLLAAEPLAGKRVIDFGCGEGGEGVWMASQGAEVYLVDRDRRAVDQALSRARTEGVERRVRGILIDGHRLDMFADRGFDLVLLHELPGKGLLGEIARAMKPGAKLLAMVGEGSAEDLAGWFGTIRVAWPPPEGWWARLAPRKKKRGGVVIAARRLGPAG